MYNMDQKKKPSSDSIRKKRYCEGLSRVRVLKKKNLEQLAKSECYFLVYVLYPVIKEFKKVEIGEAIRPTLQSQLNIKDDN